MKEYCVEPKAPRTIFWAYTQDIAAYFREAGVEYSQIFIEDSKSAPKITIEHKMEQSFKSGA